MKIKTRIGYLVLFLWAGLAPAQTELPAMKGGWWQIAEREPDVSPWNNPGLHNACDFTIWQDDYQTWHLVACIRSTTFPGATRLFHHWTSPSLTATNWLPAVHTNTFVTTNGTVTVTNGIFAVSNPDLGQYDGVMQAPHCVSNDGTYYFFYNGAYTNAAGARQNNSAYCKISEDGAHFTDTTNSAGSYAFFDMGRDIFVMKLTNQSWMSCFEYNGEMSTRTAPHPLGPWSSEVGLLGVSGNPESPFIVRRNEDYYLWQQMKVYASTDPMRFTNALVAELDAYQYAPEIFAYRDQYYMASYDSGIFLTRLDWMPTQTSSADITNLVVTTLSYGSELIPRFTYYSTEYLIVEKYAKSSLTFTSDLRDPNATLCMAITNANGQNSITVTTNATQQLVGVAALAVGENVVTLCVTNASESRSYKIHVLRKNASGQDTVSAPILPAKALFPGGGAVTLDTLNSLATIYYTLDGSTPTTDDLVYTGPITLTNTATIRALAVQSGWLDSWISQQVMEAVFPARVQGQVLAGGLPLVQWSSQSGCRYRLESTADLSDDVWDQVDVLDGTGSFLNYTSAPTLDRVYFRIQTTF